jgi:hypothetical protein
VPDIDRLLNAIDRAEEHAYSSDNTGDLAEECARNINNFLGKNTLPAPDGRSQVVDMTVKETVVWMKPSLARIFASGDNVVSLPPVGPEDEEGAKQETEYLNHIVLEKNNWFQIFDTACNDALITKRAYLHPYVEKVRQVETEKYERQTPESLALVMQDSPEVISQREYPDPDYKPEPQPAIDPMTGGPVLDEQGQPVMTVPPPPLLYDVEIRRTKVERKFCIMVFPPERCKVAQATKTVQVSTDCPYFEYYDYPTLSELRAEGYTLDGKPLPDDLAGDPDSESVTIEDAARDQYAEDDPADESSPNDPSMRRVKCRWVWIQHDYDEDGIAEKQFVVVVGRNVLHREQVNRIPVAVLCPSPLPHRHIGTCPADDAAEIQTINTVLLRQGIDNAQLSNNPMKFGDPSKVNLDDALVSRPGGFIRTRNNAIFGQDFGVLQIPDIFPSVINALTFMDNLRMKRTGVNYSFQGLDANQLSQLQPGTVNQVSSMAAQMTEQVARNIANGVAELFSLLHELVLKSGHKKEVVKLRGQWVTVDPSTWRSRTDFRISVGYSAGNKDAQIARLMGLANMQKEALVGGLPIVNARNVYETAIELTKASDFATPERFWQDPQNAPPPPPPQPDPTLLAIEQLKAQSADNVKRMDVEQKERDSQRDFAIKKYEIDTDAQTQREAEQLRINSAHTLEDRKAVNQAGIKQIEGQQAAQLKEREVQLKQQPALEMAGQVKELASKLEDGIESLKGALQIILTAKRVIKKGKNGKAEGVDIVAPDGSVIASQKVVRGPDGSLQGTQ